MVDGPNTLSLILLSSSWPPGIMLLSFFQVSGHALFAVFSTALLATTLWSAQKLTCNPSKFVMRLRRPWQTSGSPRNYERQALNTTISFHGYFLTPFLSDLSVDGRFSRLGGGSSATPCAKTYSDPLRRVFLLLHRKAHSTSPTAPSCLPNWGMLFTDASLLLYYLNLTKTMPPFSILLLLLWSLRGGSNY